MTKPGCYILNLASREDILNNTGLDKVKLPSKDSRILMQHSLV